jgi:hypothetical protein
MNMTRKDRNHIMLWAMLLSLLLFTPRVCAQTAQLNAQEAAKTRSAFVEYGKKYIGCPYISGATGPAAFDCSGFVYAVSRESIGYQLPRMVKNMYKFCKIIDESEREAGDLVFFRTTGTEEPSHVGIYIGNGQFLNCASDGPNTGVIVSSLRESYWKGKYYKTGRFLPASKSAELRDESTSPAAASGAGSSYSGNAQPSAAYETTSTGSTFLDKLVVDGMFGIDWNFFTPDYFRLTFRGLTATVHATYNGKYFKPGVGTMVRWDNGTGVLQLPLVFSITMNEYFRLFAGPVFTLGTPYLPGNSDQKIQASVFPGILGVCWNTPGFKAGKSEISFAQDIHYTVFNATDGSALSPIKSLATGIVFSSGIRVTFPLKSLLK